MAPQKKGWSSSRWLAITGLALVSIYGWWAFTQYEYLNDLNRRELADAGHELSRTIENAIETVERFDPSEASTDAPACDFQRDQQYLEFAQSCGKLHLTQPFEDVALDIEDGLGVVGKRAKQDPVRLRFRTDALLQELPFPESFGLIFVADANGVVLYQDEPTRRRWLRLLRWGERGFRDSWAAGVAGPRIQNLSTTLGEGARPSWREASAASTRTTLNFGGEWHHLYTQPLSLEKGGDTQLVLGGIVPAQEVVRRALAVDSYFVALLSFLLLLGVLGFPFIKLAALNAHERFGLPDVYLLYISTGALLALLTFGVLVIDAYARWSQVADDGLRVVADDLAAKLRDEIGAIRDRLIDYDRTLSRMDPRSTPPCADWPSHANWFGRPDPRFPLPNNEEPLYVEQAAWVRPDGQQIWKITSDKIGDKVNVGHRPYFRAVRDGNLYQVEGKGPEFFIAPDRSITDGRFYTFLSVRSGLSAAGEDGCGANRTRMEGSYVAVATVQLLSVDRPPLPAGYGFAVVNREGRVLYHSDPRLSLRENFFSELSAGQDVRAMVYAGGEHSVSGRYRERPTRIHLRPLELTRVSRGTDRVSTELDPQQNAGIYIAVFRDLTLERAVVARAFVTSLAGPMLLLVGLIIAGLGAITWASRRFEGCSGRWLWPHGGLEALYKRLTAVFLCVLLVGFVLRALGATEWVFLALPVMAAAGGILTYVLRDRNRPRGVLKHARWLMLEFGLLALCMVMVPSGALFGLTLGHEFGTLIATEQKWIEEQLEDVVLAVRAEAKADEHPDEIGEHQALSRRNRFGKWPSPYDEQLGRIEGGARFIVHAYEWIDQRLPVESDVVSRQRYQELEVTFDPPGLFGLRLGWVAMLGIAATIAALMAWVHWNSRRLFYCDVEPAAGEPQLPADLEAVWRNCSEEEQHLLMHVSSERIANPYQRPLVLKLLNEGLLRLGPELQPSTPAWDAFIREKCQDATLAARLRESERVAEAHSWGHVRTLLFVSIAVLAGFLIATQPGLQSDLVGIASAATAAATALLKLREIIGTWFEQRKAVGV